MFVCTNRSGEAVALGLVRPSDEGVPRMQAPPHLGCRLGWYPSSGNTLGLTYHFSSDNFFCHVCLQASNKLWLTARNTLWCENPSFLLPFCTLAAGVFWVLLGNAAASRLSLLHLIIFSRIELLSENLIKKWYSSFWKSYHACVCEEATWISLHPRFSWTEWSPSAATMIPSPFSDRFPCSPPGSFLSNPRLPLDYAKIRNKERNTAEKKTKPMRGKSFGKRIK